MQPDTVSRADCDAAHDGEVYLLGSLQGYFDEDEEYPGVEEVGFAVDDECWLAYEDYVGRPFEDSAFGYALYGPDAQSWAAATATLPAR